LAGSTDLTDFGKLLRARRRQRMMTLRQLSERTGLSVSLLSEIERGVAQPSMASLKKISHAMGFSLFDSLGENHGAERASQEGKDTRTAGRTYVNDVKVVRANQRKRVMNPTHSPFVYELLTPDFKRQMEVLLLRWEPGFSSGPDPILDSPGEKFLLVMKGAVELQIGQTVVQLGQGDSVYYPSDFPVFFRVLGEEACEALGVATPPTF